jgi:7-cyano-7-deazaguanine synthase
LELIKERYPAQCDNLLAIEILLKPGQKHCEESIYFTYFKEFQKHGRIGHQYLWLPIIADLHNLKELELSTEKEDASNVAGTWAEIVYPLLHGTGHERRVDLKSTKDEKLKLFTHFRFPISDNTKDDMYMIAAKVGFQDILKYTWHCHYPIFKRPCGLCRPCTISKTHKMKSVHKPINILFAKTYNFVGPKFQKLLES